MKPEKGLDDMEEKVYDPQELFREIGLLVTEARTPVQSVKGREEGPHCPPVSGVHSGHECDRHKEQCRKASDFLRLQSVLWQNKIPMRLDVLLFPNCEHGYREETVVEGAAMSSVDNFELFERWDVQLVKKRSPERLEGFVNGRSHIQAVRSYLHFSQLSSWLISTGGALPHRIVYRAYAPGESVSYSFSRLPEVHNFPSADLGDFVMRTTVAHLPRQSSLMKIVCRSPSPGIEPHLRTIRHTSEEKCPHMQTINEPVASTSKCYDDSFADFQVAQDHRKDKMEYGKSDMQQRVQKPPIGRKLKHGKQDDKLKTKSNRTMPCPISNTPKRKVDQLSPTMHYRQNVMYGAESDEIYNKCSVQCVDKRATMESQSDNSVINLISPQTSEKSSAESPFKYPAPVSPSKTLHYKKPTTLTVSTTSVVTSKRLPSPKVLVTGSTRPEPSTYKKRCLDLTGPETITEKSEDFIGYNDMEDITANNICDLVKPLSPSDLEAYLSSLSNKASKRHRVSKLDDIPTTKCSFFLGEDGLENTVINPPNSNEVTQTNVCDKSHELTASDCVFDSQTDSTQSLSKSKHVEKNRPQYVRSLFPKSLSVSEVEDELYGHQVLKAQHGHVGHDQIENDNSDQISEKPANDLVPNSSKVIQENHRDNSSYDAIQSCDQSRGLNLSTSQRKRTLFDQSIPCSVGGVNIAMNSLMQNLESMEIDDRPCSSLTLDKEVEGHLNQKLSCHGKEVFLKDKLSSSPNPEDTETSSPSQKGLSLCKQLLQKEFQQNVKNEIFSSDNHRSKKSLPSPDDIQKFRFIMGRSASAIFNANTGLPSRSSPAPIKKKSSTKFDYDCSLTSVRAIKNALSCSKLTLQSEEYVDTVEDPKIISTSAPASTNCLLGNFEESVLNGRIEPVGVVDGFSVEIGASGLFCPKHISLPVAAYFFHLSDDNAPSPYLGHVNLEPLGKRGYHIPRIGTVQVTLFNPNRTVVKMFVVMYDLSDMPANCQTFLRQRTVYMPADENSSEASYLRYLIHLRFQSSKSGKIYLHTDIRLIFARDKFEFDPRVANYELRSFTESPINPKFSPKR